VGASAGAFVIPEKPSPCEWWHATAKAIALYAVTTLAKDIEAIIEEHYSGAIQDELPDAGKRMPTEPQTTRCPKCTRELRKCI
jgi:hypothetical protein